MRLNKNMISAMGENGFFGLTSNDVGTIVSQHSDILNLSLGPLLLVAWDKWGGSGTMRCHTYMKDLRPVSIMSSREDLYPEYYENELIGL